MTVTDLNRIRSVLRAVQPDIRTATIAEIGAWRRMLTQYDQVFSMYYQSTYSPGTFPNEFGQLRDRAAEEAGEEASP